MDGENHGNPYSKWIMIWGEKYHHLRKHPNGLKPGLHPWLQQASESFTSLRLMLLNGRGIEYCALGFWQGK